MEEITKVLKRFGLIDLFHKPAKLNASNAKVKLQIEIRR